MCSEETQNKRFNPVRTAPTAAQPEEENQRKGTQDKETRPKETTKPQGPPTAKTR